MPSTTTVLAAEEALVSAAFPDAKGRFQFTDLLGGRYYLALLADPVLLDDPDLVVYNSPGAFRLRPGIRRSLFPIEFRREEARARAPAKGPKGPPRPPPGRPGS